MNPYDVEGAAEVYYRALDDAARGAPRAARAAARRGSQTYDVHRWAATLPRAARGDHARRAPRSAPTAGVRPRAARSRSGSPTHDAPAAPPRLRRHAGAVHAPRPSWPGRTRALLELLARARQPARHRGARGERPARGDAGASGSATCRSGSTPSTASGLARSGDAPVGAGRASCGGTGASRCWRSCARSPQRTPGSLIEEKSAALAWHYRMADQESGARRANELRLHLSQLLSNQPVEILAGQQGDRDPALRRPQGPDRAAAPSRAAGRRPPSSPSATTAPTRTCSPSLPPEAITIKVGPAPPARGSGWTASPRVRQLLRSLLETRRRRRAGAAVSPDHPAHRDPRRARRPHARSRRPAR